MGRVKRLNSKVNAKQKTNADLPLNPKIVSTFEYTAVTTASQTVITLPFSVEQITNVKKNFEVIIDGAHLVEGASNDYQFTNIAPNNTSSEITLNSSVTAGLNIRVRLLGIASQNEPSNPNLQSQISSNDSDIAALQSSIEEIAFIKDVKSTGTAGGTFTSGAWQTRDLNTLETNGAPSWVTAPATNQFTLQAGTYKISGVAPAYQVNRHQTKLRNITDSTDDIIGHATYSSSAGGVENTSTFLGVITINATKTFEFQHRCETTQVGNGFGVNGNFGVSEIYAQLEIRKL